MGGGNFGIFLFLSYIHDCILHGHTWRSFFLRFFSTRLIGLVELFI